MALGPGSLSFRILKGIAYGTGGKRKVKKDVEGPLTSKWLWQITGKRASDGKANPNLFTESNTKRIREDFCSIYAMVLNRYITYAPCRTLASLGDNLDFGREIGILEHTSFKIHICEMSNLKHFCNF